MTTTEVLKSASLGALAGVALFAVVFIAAVVA